MKKKIVSRCLLGAPIGLAISFLITVFISLAIADGNFYAVAPELAENCGSELNAVVLQTACSLLYGAAWGGASVIWEQEKWSILRMTLTHLIVTSLASFPIAYFMNWMPHDVLGVLIYFSVFFAVYLIVWLSNFLAIRHRIRQINKKVMSQEK